MILIINTRNNDNSTLGTFSFVSPEGGLHKKPNGTCVKMCRRYVGSAIYLKTFVETIREKVTGIKLQCGCKPVGKLLFTSELIDVAISI